MTVAELIKIAKDNGINDFKIVFSGNAWSDVKNIFISYETKQIYLW